VSAALNRTLGRRRCLVSPEVARAADNDAVPLSRDRVVAFGSYRLPGRQVKFSLVNEELRNARGV
jgi:hypothetical protein